MKPTSLKVKSPEMLALLAKQRDFGPVRLSRYAEHENHSFISRMLRGDPKAQWVTPKTARLVSEALAVPVEFLFAVQEVKSLDSTRSVA